MQVTEGHFEKQRRRANNKENNTAIHCMWHYCGIVDYVHMIIGLVIV